MYIEITTGQHGPNNGEDQLNNQLRDQQVQAVRLRVCGLDLLGSGFGFIVALRLVVCFAGLGKMEDDGKSKERPRAVEASEASSTGTFAKLGA